MRFRWLTLMAVALVLTLALAACGDEDDDDDADTGANGAGTEQPSGGSGEAAAVAMLDAMAFEPETLEVGAGEEVTILLTNDGAIEHNFSIEDADVDVTLSGGEEEEFTFTAPDEPGEYKIWCSVPGHEAAGMIGTLVVE